MGKKTKLNSDIYKEMSEKVSNLTDEDIHKMNIYQKMGALSIELMGKIARNGKNQVYPYILLPDIQEEVLPLEYKYGLKTQFSKYPQGAFTEAASNGRRMAYVRHQYGFAKTVNTDDTKEYVITDGIDFTGGNDDSSKAGGNGDTYGQRYGYLMIYQIQNTDFDLDADSEETSQRNAELAKNSTPEQKEFVRVMNLMKSNGSEILPQVKEILVDKKLIKEDTKSLNGGMIHDAIKQDLNIFKNIK